MMRPEREKTLFWLRSCLRVGLALSLTQLVACQEEEPKPAPQFEQKTSQLTPLPPPAPGWPGVDFVATNSVFVGSPDRSFSEAEERVFGFEAVADWQVYSGAGTLTNSTTNSEGDKSLSFNFTATSGYLGAANTIAIKKDDQPPPEVVGYDVLIPTQQVNPYWSGGTEIYIHAPSAGLNNQYLGYRAFSGLPKGQFVRVEYVVPTAIRSQLDGVNYQDLKFIIAINVANGSASHLVDRFTLGPDPGPAGAQLSGQVAVTVASGGPMLTGNAELTIGVDTTLTGNVWADTLNLRGGSKMIGDANYNTKTGPGVVQGTVDSPLPLPLSIALPSIPTVQTSTQNISVSASQTRNLSAGSYGSVTLAAGANSITTKLRLSGGTYHFSSIQAGNASEITCSAACEVRVSGRVNFNQYVKLGPAAGSGLAPAQVKVIVLGQNGGNGGVNARPSAFNTLTGTQVKVYLHVPNGTARFVRGTMFEGRVVARDLLLGSGVTLDGCAPNDSFCDGADDDCDGFVDEDYVAQTTQCGVGACAAQGATSCVAGQVQNNCAPQPPLSTVDTTCNAIDDDCDGQTDEQYAPVATACGQGVCARTGVTSCVQGTVANSCVPGAPSHPSDTLCNALDDDCDGQVDEQYVPLPTSCGVGACLAAGQTQCVSGAVMDSCVAGIPAPADTTCNGLDENCNGTADEGYQPMAVSCGVGACQNSGQTVCSAGTVVEQCTPGQAAAQDATCNGVDDDCSGGADEDYTPRASSCGVGACARTGTVNCVAGGEVDSCAAGDPATNDVSCDGIDSDCDGQIDENYAGGSTSCGMGVCAATGQLSCQAGAVVDSCEAGTGDTTDTTCDGVDDDCDGEIDEDYVASPTSCGVGACSAQGATSCQEGQEVDSCEPGTVGANDATCDGIDNDCDGSTDEDFTAGSSTCGVGACAAHGTVTCVDGEQVDSCDAGAPAASDAVCDGLDNDCDGSVDEDYAPTSTTCGQGACGSTGQTACVNGQITDTCAPGVPGTSDATCNGIDEDCDGAKDEDYVATDTACGQGACAATGRTSCIGGAVADSCAPSAPAPLDASCDGVDNDCDGAVDENYVSVPTTCGVGACAAAGSTSCQAGVVNDSCQPHVAAPSDASCDGIDQDCSGEADEDFVAGSTSCGVGVCARASQTSCVQGHIEGVCVPGTPAALDASCDGLDDDCDGEIDEEYAPHATQCGVGTCGSNGSSSCVNGVEGNSCVPGTPGAAQDLVCDGLDNDCDGQTDEEVVSSATSCGVGACASTGTLSCISGSPVNSCTPLEGDTIDANCDGVDDDCDGTADEDYVATATSCGVGACGATGQLDCVAGELVDSCSAGSPAESDANCNGADDDCNGQVDEDYSPTPTSCGLGVCQSSGVLNCVNGAAVDSCVEATGDASDTTCDGLDDDCDGLVDEEYVALATQCGEGACGSVGATSCEDGQETDSCEPGTPGAADVTCDGLDNDCDGSIDEGFVAASTSCGVGACAATGVTSCVAGGLQDSCVEQEPALDDASCDGIDNDCNGTIDEDYVDAPTACGIGACAAVGVARCENGSITDDCAPDLPAASDATCDGVDDDCSGSADEDYVSQATSCGVGACVAAGATSCVAGQVRDSCLATEPAASDASCNGIDEDCDGTVDDGFLGNVTSCGVGACQAAGVQVCQSGVIGDSCVASEPQTDDATCNGLDDDCDGEADEDYQPQLVHCGVGACSATGTTVCENGVVTQQCDPGEAAASDLTCDGVDDDCDGSVDEDHLTVAVSCGLGVCARDGTKQCLNGSEQTSCTPGLPAENDAVCDGLDNDCNGETDEDYVETASSCGVGACSAVGVNRCQSGALVDSCVPTSPSPTDAACDGVDSDCDGNTDEDYVAVATQCGVGQCASTGTSSCVAGTVRDNCTPSVAAANDSACDGMDNDCDGEADEDYASLPTSCGVGQCQATGTTSCVDGAEVNSCQPATASADDATCNGLDDDCDGTVDEDYLPDSTACGQGACRTSGTIACQDGTTVVLCTPLPPPSPSDATCDGVDNDCNGAVDEDFLSQTVSCGVGACRESVQTTCENGSVSNQCTPRFPTYMSDLICDGIDEDCDGAIDEDYASAGVTCGVGSCAATGTTQCVAGQTVEQCTPHSPAAQDATCNNLDEDCDGDVDEDFVEQCSGNATATCDQGQLSLQQCNDGNVCNGTETCSAASCRSGTAPLLDDGNPCTIDACDPATGVEHSPAAMGTSCGVGQTCNGAGSCVAGPVIVRQPQGLNLVPGQSFNLFVEATGDQLSYQWYRDGNTLPGETRSLLSVVSAHLGHDGAIYTVQVSNPLAQVMSQPAQIRVGDLEGPILELTSPAVLSTGSDPIVVTGIAGDSGAGIQSVWVTNDRYPGVTLNAIIQSASGNFQAEVPLAPGLNQLTVHARDAAQNISSLSVSATLLLSSIPEIELISPAFGSVVGLDTVDVVGVVRSSLNAAQLRVELGTRTTYPQGSGGEYEFIFEDVRLTPGLNILQVVAVSPETRTTKSLQVFFGSGDEQVTGNPPRLSLNGITGLTYETSVNHRISGTVTADTCVASVSINGVLATTQGTGNFVSFSHALTVPNDGMPFPVQVRATDCLNRFSQASYQVIYDAAAPVVSLSVADAPTVTQVEETPYHILGSIAEPNLAGISVGSQSIGAIPTGNGTWQFEVALNLAAGEERRLDIEVWDQSGNREKRQVILALDASLEIAWLSPENGQEIMSLDDPSRVDFAIRVPGLASSDRAELALDNRPVVIMSGGGEVRTASVELPLATGSHGAVARIVASDGHVKAQSSVHFTLQNAEEIAPAVVSVIPARDVRDVEASEPIIVTFNRPVETEQVLIEVRESGRAKVQRAVDPSGGFITNAQIELVDIARNAEVVPGGTSPLPGDRSFVFYPTREYLFGAQVKVSVRYENAPLFASTFQVRSVPTVLDGIVFDQDLNPVVGVEVGLPTQNRTVLTDSSGAFHFGYGAISERMNGGMQPIVVNPNGAMDDYGSLELMINPQEGRLTTLNGLSIPRWDNNRAREFLGGGAPYVFSDDELELDLSQATVLFPGGAASGAVLVQPFLHHEYPRPTGGSSFPVFSFVMQPPGVKVSGPLSVRIHLPDLPKAPEYRQQLPEYVLLVGVDPATLLLIPIGVGHIDPDAGTVQSVGPVVAERLDVIGVAIPAAGELSVLPSYGRGDLTLEQLRSAVRGY